MIEKKILHISPTDIRYDSRILKELKSLESIENTVLLAYGINDDEGHDYQVSLLDYVKTYTLYTKKMRFFPRPLRYALNLIEAIIRLTIPAVKYRPDIVHCHDTLFLPIALLVKSICKSKLIYDAHELESDKAGQSKILSKYTLYIEKVSWKNIDILISVSPSIIDWYKSQFGYKKSKLILNSPQFSESTKGQSESNYLREKFNIPKGKSIYLYLGIISKYGRGVQLYLEAFKSTKIKSHLIFVGYGDYVDEIIAASNEFDNIHYHRSVVHNKVVEISNSADFGLCMIEPISLSDTFCLPNKLFEYAFADLYIISSDLPDIKKVITDFGLGTYCKNTVDDLMNVIHNLETINPKRDNRNLYPLSWQYQEEKLIQLYNNLI
jgi:glycosyltransferase involved in cell wall biosynthesis